MTKQNAFDWAKKIQVHLVFCYFLGGTSPERGSRTEKWAQKQRQDDRWTFPAARMYYSLNICLREMTSNINQNSQRHQSKVTAEKNHSENCSFEKKVVKWYYNITYWY